jgi:hypothetical protein
LNRPNEPRSEAHAKRVIEKTVVIVQRRKAMIGHESPIGVGPNVKCLKETPAHRLKRHVHILVKVLFDL